jgi:NADH:ubiquinone oxidoreductase subunit F (NADH-binding)
MNHLTAPKGWSQPLLGSGLAPWAGLRAAVAAGPHAVLAALDAAQLHCHRDGGASVASSWRATAATTGETRYAVAHAYESDPALFTTRLLLEQNAQAVVEGLAIAAFTMGAREAIVALRADDEQGARAIETVITNGVREGAFGSIALRVRALQGSSMIGESTVLMKALDGKRGQPEQTPPYPATVGYLGKPTAVTRAATLAAVPWILVHGAAEYAAIGDPAEPGTMLVQIGGAVGTPGVLEVPTGTTLADIVAAAGGTAKSATLKALLVGGPAGGFIPAQLLPATPYSSAGLVTVGARIGSGAVLALDASVEIPELAAMLTRWSADEACGKTIPCRIGTRRLAEIGQRFVDGLAGPADAARLQTLAADIADSALCVHEAQASTPLLSGMRYFEHEFLGDAVSAAPTRSGRS